jgi:3-hydroxyisobutyrate dehydrogenase-like beta-hydroxyacid dehydrogenase
MRVAVLGTGKMGGAVARRLNGEGHQLVLWNRTRSRAEAIGVGRVAATPAEAVSAADVVISILTNADAVRSAYLGPDGAVRGASDQVFVEMSTAGPDVVREVRPAVERGGAKFVECPVIGSVPTIETGGLVLFASGDDEAIGKAAPVLGALGEVRRIKDPETAAKEKLIANSALGIVNAMAAELMAAGAAAGVDKEDVFWILARFAPSLSARRAEFLEHRYEPVTFALRDELKDLRLATEVYRRAGASTPVTDAARAQFERAAPAAADLDLAAIAIAYEKEPAAKRS